MDIKLITELNPKEKIWWEHEIKNFRGRIIQEPKSYAKTVIEERGFNKSNLTDDIESIIEKTREEIWQTYLIDEALFHQELLTHLSKSRHLPKSILINLISKRVLDTYKDIGRIELQNILSEIVGEYTGRIMPYIYLLSLSTTNSRRSRSGKTFETLIEALFDVFEYPYTNQSSIGNAGYESNLGKKVDLIVPSIDSYIKNRPMCAVVTMKTSLRERWQEVAEELNRTNVPHIYLLTADRGVTPNTVSIMKRYNITLVVYQSEKTSKFEKFANVQDFRTFFLQEIPHILSYWK